ncbi:MAG TPA: hypothetical protein VK043_13760, partial [Burkholderiales bacterium]|nr:hypothetical protein [Burkholderiales bacterium]
LAESSSRAPMKKAFLLLALTGLAACASTPSGPGVLVLPGSGKSFDHFRFDDHECRQYASSQVGDRTPDQAAADAGARSAVAGAVIGGLAGAALGGSRGAAAGAGLGGAGGALAGTGAAGYSSRNLQQRYDYSYQQCMYAKGHKIPMAQGYQRPRHRPAMVPPPPPPGAPPPPPPG